MASSSDYFSASSAVLRSSSVSSRARRFLGLTASSCTSPAASEGSSSSHGGSGRPSTSLHWTSEPVSDAENDAATWSGTLPYLTTSSLAFHQVSRSTSSPLASPRSSQQASTSVKHKRSGAFRTGKSLSRDEASSASAASAGCRESSRLHEMRLEQWDIPVDGSVPSPPRPKGLPRRSTVTGTDAARELRLEPVTPWSVATPPADLSGHYSAERTPLATRGSAERSFDDDQHRWRNASTWSQNSRSSGSDTHATSALLARRNSEARRHLKTTLPPLPPSDSPAATPPAPLSPPAAGAGSLRIRAPAIDKLRILTPNREFESERWSPSITRETSSSPVALRARSGSTSSAFSDRGWNSPVQFAVAEGRPAVSPSPSPSQPSSPSQQRPRNSAFQWPAPLSAPAHVEHASFSESATSNDASKTSADRSHSADAATGSVDMDADDEKEEIFEEEDDDRLFSPVSGCRRGRRPYLAQVASTSAVRTIGIAAEQPRPSIGTRHLSVQFPLDYSSETATTLYETVVWRDRDVVEGERNRHDSTSSSPSSSQTAASWRDSAPLPSKTSDSSLSSRRSSRSFFEETSHPGGGHASSTTSSYDSHVRKSNEDSSSSITLGANHSKVGDRDAAAHSRAVARRRTSTSSTTSVSSRRNSRGLPSYSIVASHHAAQHEVPFGGGAGSIDAPFADYCDSAGSWGVSGGYGGGTVGTSSAAVQKAREDREAEHERKREEMQLYKEGILRLEDQRCSVLPRSSGRRGPERGRPRTAMGSGDSAIGEDAIGAVAGTGRAALASMFSRPGDDLDNVSGEETSTRFTPTSTPRPTPHSNIAPNRHSIRRKPVPTQATSDNEKVVADTGGVQFRERVGALRNELRTSSGPAKLVSQNHTDVQPHAPLSHSRSPPVAVSPLEARPALVNANGTKEGMKARGGAEDRQQHQDQHHRARANSISHSTSVLRKSLNRVSGWIVD